MRFVRSTLKPVRGRISTAHVASEAMARKNKTSMNEYSATCHFERALEIANMTVAPSMNKMPSGIRSARPVARARLSAVKGKAPGSVGECLAWPQIGWQGQKRIAGLRKRRGRGVAPRIQRLMR